MDGFLYLQEAVFWWARDFPYIYKPYEYTAYITVRIRFLHYRYLIFFGESSATSAIYLPFGGSNTDPHLEYLDV